MHVLIVDDTQLNITLMQHLIKKLPECEAHGFTDPVQALAWCDDHVPDLVVVDYMMPVLDGIEFTRRFRAMPNYSEIPVLMVTANHEASVRHESLNGGVTDFLNKPLDNAEFLARAKNMLALRQSHKNLADHAAWLDGEVRKATAEIVAREQETIFCLARATEYRDPETGAHIMRMAHYSRLIARALALSEADQQLVLEAAPMHDIGKVGTPDMVLLKPGKLTAAEFEIMKQHAYIGYEVLSVSSAPLLKVAAEIAWTHHEKFDGSGYPRGLAGQAIPLFGRIVAVADVFDALTSDRPYKQAWTVEAARDYLQEARGKHFDPDCVDVFIANWDEVIAIKEKYSDEHVELRDRTMG